MMNVYRFQDLTFEFQTHGIDLIWHMQILDLTID